MDEQGKDAPAFTFIGEPNLEGIAILVERVNRWADEQDRLAARSPVAVETETMSRAAFGAGSPDAGSKPSDEDLRPPRSTEEG